tara:strand:- start:1281 stop:1469 length:189 start_codon:yes stop_codon:yes gene_type:complete
VGSQVSGVNHQNIFHIVLRFGQLLEDALENAVFQPPLESVIERLVWAKNGVCIVQPVLQKPK